MAVHLSRHNNNSAAVTMLNQILEHLLSCVARLLLIYTHVWIGVRYCSVNASAGAVHQQNPEVREEAGIFQSLSEAAAKQKKTQIRLCVAQEAKPFKAES